MIIDSGSTRAAMSTRNVPTGIHSYSVFTIRRASAGFDVSCAVWIAARRNDARTPIEATHPAERPGQRFPVSSRMVPPCPAG